MKVKAHDNNSLNAAARPLSQSQQHSGQNDKKSAEHQEFIREMNEFVAKAGLLSDDPFFGGL
jgi:antitoxin CcdA